MTASFIHLHLHTEYSIVDSVVRIKPLLDATAAAGMPAVAITDHNNLFGMVKFYREALKCGIKPIIGAEIMYLDPDDESGPCPLVLLCADITGYRNLSRLVTRAYSERHDGGQVLIERSWLADCRAEGLLALSAGRVGGPGRALLADKFDEAQRQLDGMLQLFGDRYYLELQRTGRPGEQACNARTVELAARTGCPVVATNDVRFLAETDFEAHEARVCIHQGCTLDDTSRPREYSPQQYLRTPQEMTVLFEDLPEALQNSVEIAKRCNLTLDLDEPHLPVYAVPEGFDTDSFLAHEAREGLARRLHVDADELPETYAQRLERELEVICGMGFPGYFLIVADFIRWAQRNDIPVGPGRGSGAGSVVAWALGITDLDPIEHELLFERFLNPERVSMPDFDIDFCMEGRDRVIDYVAERYGRGRVSQIITYGSMAAKAVVRDCGRVLGHSYGFVDRIAKLIPFELGIKLDKALEQEAELKSLYESDDDVRSIIDLARQLEGLVRNAGRHAGGVVIAPSEITDFTPLYRVEGEKGTVTQFDKEDVEAAGLVKFDFLGLRTLTIIDRAVKTINIRRQAAGEELLDIRKLPMDDPAAYRLLQQCRTTAIFQLESRGIRELIRRLRPDQFEDIVALVALYRPGPLQSGMVDDFVARKHGEHDGPIDYLHPDLEPVLVSTYGVILYQEQVMQIAQRLAGYSLGAADLLRRAMGKKKPEEMAKQRSIFMAGATEKGVEPRVAERIFDLMEKFAGYGFNKSHSAAYAVLSYQTAWLKAHYPAAFLAAVMSCEMDDTDKLTVLKRDCEAEKLVLLRPDVNESGLYFEVAGDSAIRYGLGAIKGLGRGAVELLLAAREQGPFESLDDLCQRVDAQRLGRRALEALIKAGALDDLGPNRPSLLAALPDALARAEQAAHARASGQEDMFSLDAPVSVAASSSTVVEVEDWGFARRLEAERESLGLYLSGHPFDQYRADGPFVSSGTIAAMIGQRVPAAGNGQGWQGGREVSVAGVVTNLRKRGGRITLELDDGRDRLEVGLYQEVFDKYRHLLVSHAIVVVTGKLRFSEYIDGWRLTAREVTDIDRLIEKRASGLVLRWQECRQGPLDARRLQRLLEPFRPGHCEVSLYLERVDSRARVRFDRCWAVRPGAELRDRLSAVLGADGYRFIYQQPHG